MVGNDALPGFKKALADFSTETGLNVKRVQVDAGTAFRSDFKAYCESQHISFTPGQRDTPQKNGKVERCIQTIWRHTKSNLMQSRLEWTRWPEALQYTIYTHNRIPRNKMENGARASPYELERKEKPNVAHLLPFGCRGYRLMPKLKQNKR